MLLFIFKVNMVIDKIFVSFCNFDDVIFWKEEFLNVKEENLMYDIKLFNGEFLSCFLSKKEIEYCLDLQYIKDNFIDIKKIGVGGFGLVYEVVYIIENRKYVFKFVKIFFLDFDKNEVKILVLFKYFNVFRYYIFWIILFNECNFCLKGFGFKNLDSIVFFEKDVKLRNDKILEIDCGVCLVI